MDYYGSPRWSQEILDCGMPMTFDTYSNCAFNCLYCFSQYQRGIAAPIAYFLKKCKHVNPDKIRAMFTDPDNHGGQFSDYIKGRYAMQWGGLSDQFDGFERKYGKTLELMEFFRTIRYPISFSTKSTWVFEDERYVKLIEGMHDWHFKFSIISTDEKKCNIIEQGCPTPKERLNALKKVKEMGVGGVTLRFRPFIIGLSEDTCEELVVTAAENGADSVSLEFFCLENRANALTKIKYKIMSRTLGFDVLDFYKKHSYTSGYLRLNYEKKRPYVDKIEGLCKKLNIRFHVSDAHHKERGAHGCCCGVPLHFKYFPAQMTEGAVRCKRTGEFSFSDLDPAVEIFKKFDWNGASGFNTGSVTKRAKMNGASMYDYVRNAWNNPAQLHSPYKYLDEAMLPDRVDENGNVVYKFNEKKCT